MANCMFCGESKVTKEHLWGKWWQKYYPASATDHLLRGNHEETRSNPDGSQYVGKGLFSNSGDPLSYTTKVVCRACNNTWMSRIEEGMRHAFEQLYITGSEEVTPDLSIAIQNWMFLKYCLIDRSYEDYPASPNPVGTDAELRALIDNAQHRRWRNFMNLNSPPKDYRFFISRCGPKNLIGCYNFVSLKIPLINRVRILDIIFADSCLLAVGKFLGVVTNNKDLAGYLENYDTNTQPEHLTDLTASHPRLSARHFINCDVFENNTLSFLEQCDGNTYRRSFNRCLTRRNPNSPET